MVKILHFGTDLPSQLEFCCTLGKNISAKMWGNCRWVCADHLPVGRCRTDGNAKDARHRSDERLPSRRKKENSCRMKGESREPPRTRGLRPAELAPPVLALLFFYTTHAQKSKEEERPEPKRRAFPLEAHMKRKEKCRRIKFRSPHRSYRLSATNTADWRLQAPAPRNHPTDRAPP